MKMAELIAVSNTGTQMFILLFSVHVFENFPINVNFFNLKILIKKF